MTGMFIYDCFPEDVGRGLHNLNVDELKLSYTNRAPAIHTDRRLSDISEVAATGGYPAGGIPVLSTTWNQTSGLAKLTGVNTTFTSSGSGTVGPFRYVVLRNAARDLLIGWWDRGTPITLDATAHDPFVIFYADTSDIFDLEWEA